MKGKILASTTLFIVTFVISLWLMFPYEKFAISIINSATAKSGIDISYEEIESGALSTTLSELEINSIPIGKLKVGYSPLSIISKAITVDSSGYVNLKSTLSEKSSKFDLKTGGAILNALSKDVKFSGDLKSDGVFSIKEETADLKAYIDNISFKTPVGEMSLRDVRGNFNLEGDKLTVRSLTSEDSTKLRLKGDIRINRRNPVKSFVNLSGSLNLFGQEKRIRLSGRGTNIKPEIK